MPVRATRHAIPADPTAPEPEHERLTRYLRAATRVAADLSGCAHEGQALQTVCDAMVTDLDAAFAGVWLLDPDGRLLVQQAEARRTTFSGATGHSRIDVTTSPTAMAAVARSRSGIVRNRLADGPAGERHWRERDGIDGVAVFPLADAGIVLGVLAYFSHDQLHVGVAEVLSAWATIVGSTVQNIRLVQREQLARAAAAAREAEKSALLTRLISAQEDERARLAGDLHDGPIQALSVLLMKQDRAVRMLDRGRPEVAMTEMSAVQDGMMEQVTALRRQMVALRPYVLDEHGLVSALHVLAGEFEHRFGRRCEVRSAAAPPLTGEIATTLFRIAQEAIVNAGKHAAPSPVDVEVTREDGHVMLTVADRGPGFAGAREFVSGHYGLASMRERAEVIGGRLVIQRRPGGGALVRATVPLRSPASQQTSLTDLPDAPKDPGPSHPSGTLTLD
jgi:signal transduction histidine kinase